MLWELARGLTVQQCSEILGAPGGYEHLFLAPNAMPQDAVDAVKNGRLVLVHDVMSPISLKAVGEALAPAHSFGAPLSIRPIIGDLPWDIAAREQSSLVEEAIRRGRDLIPRFAVFSFSQISLAVHRGFILSDRVHVDCYQFDRNANSWNWPESAAADTAVKVVGLPDRVNRDAKDVVVRVNLSDSISPDDSRVVATTYAVTHIDSGE